MTPSPIAPDVAIRGHSIDQTAGQRAFRVQSALRQGSPGVPVPAERILRAAESELAALGVPANEIREISNDLLKVFAGTAQLAGPFLAGKGNPQALMENITKTLAGFESRLG